MVTSPFVQYNFFRQGIVTKMTLDGRVKIVDSPDLTREIVKLGNPDLIIDVFHTSHQYFNEQKYNRFRITLGEASNLVELLPFFRPGEILGDLQLVENKVRISDGNGKSTMVRCSCIVVKVTGVEKD